MDTFSKFLLPITVETFFSTYWRKEPLFIKGELDAETIVSLEEINDYFSNISITYPHVRIVAGGELDIAKYSIERVFNFLDKNQVFKLFEEGNTVVIQSGQSAFKNLADFLSRIERELMMDVNANIYITPADSRGFDPHYDTHEVIAIQVSGTKKWNIYDLAAEAPIKGMGLNDEQRKHYLNTTPTHSITMEEGDILYLPRGVVHDAYTEDEMSIHITLGFTPLLRLSLLHQVLKKAESLSFFREPLGITADRNEQSLFMEEISKLIKESMSFETKKEFKNPFYYDTKDIFYQFFIIDNSKNLSDVQSLNYQIINDGLTDLEASELEVFNWVQDMELSLKDDLKALKKALKSLIRKKAISVEL